MKIKITKQELERQVKEAVRKYLTEDQPLLTEMAVERKVYVNKSIDVISPLMRHVLLITYCKLYDKENQNLQHWKGEIVTFCEPITKVSLKNVSKANQVVIKNNVLIKTWIDGFEITSNEYVNDIWTIISEQKKIVSGLTEDMVKIYTNIIHNIINCISNSNVIELKNYIYSL